MAIAEAEKYPDLKASMQRVLKESRELAARSVAEVKSLIGRLNIRP